MDVFVVGLLLQLLTLEVRLVMLLSDPSSHERKPTDAGHSLTCYYCKHTRSLFAGSNTSIVIRSVIDFHKTYIRM